MAASLEEALARGMPVTTMWFARGVGLVLSEQEFPNQLAGSQELTGCEG